jgi:hypothetical protein
MDKAINMRLIEYDNGSIVVGRDGELIDIPFWARKELEDWFVEKLLSEMIRESQPYERLQMLKTLIQQKV